MSNYTVDDIGEGWQWKKNFMRSAMSSKSIFFYFVLLIMLEQYVESNHWTILFSKINCKEFL